MEIEYMKYCPECGNKQTYKTSKSLKTAIKKNRTCKVCSNTGERNPAYGKPCSKYVKDAIRKAHTGKIVSEETRQKHRDKFISEETRQKHSENWMGIKNPMSGKNYWNGGPMTDEIKKKLSLCRKGIPITPEHRENIGKARIGKTHTEETKRKMRIAKIKHIQEKNGGVAPRYNILAGEYFLSLETERRWNGMYATKNGEFHITHLGYFVDYYEPTHNIVVEYDEPKHYNVDETLKVRDVVRMNEIKSYLGCKFYRYNQAKKTLTEY